MYGPDERPVLARRLGRRPKLPWGGSVRRQRGGDAQLAVPMLPPRLRVPAVDTGPRAGPVGRRRGVGGDGLASESSPAGISIYIYIHIDRSVCMYVRTYVWGGDGLASESSPGAPLARQRSVIMPNYCLLYIYIYNKKNTYPVWAHWAGSGPVAVWGRVGAVAAWRSTAWSPETGWLSE